MDINRRQERPPIDATLLREEVWRVCERRQ
jgi:hypothetical protein